VIVARLTMDRIAEALDGQVVGGDPQTTFAGVSTDSRTIQPGQLFVALAGDRFDGHRFCRAAAENGAAGAMVQTDRVTGDDWPSELARIEVADTLRALGDLAGLVRIEFTGQVAAVTGSNGKTTTKEMLARMLARRRTVLKTEGNLNNLIGLPLTLLRLADKHQAAVVEMGMDRPGEIARLTEIAGPTLGLITNVGPAHLKRLGSVEAVAAAKGELFAGLSPIATAVVNADDSLVTAQAGRFDGEKLTFGFASGADVRIQGLVTTIEGSTFELVYGRDSRLVRLALVGTHNAANALAAAAAAIALGESLADIVAALADFRPLAGRQNFVRLAGGTTLIDDTYNANPASMAAALRTLAAVRGEGRGLCALGDMLDLGENSAPAHRRIGRLIGALDLGPVFLLGQWADEVAAGAREAGLNSAGARRYDGHDQLAEALGQEMKPTDTVLVKGSRGAAMDKVVTALMEER
jgi:UDP-N-acetylmuramoyl-tripeptide--D-alanyl-D-alanine ligase